MRRFKLISIFLVIFFSLFIFSGCNLEQSDNDNSIPVLSLITPKFTLEVGSTTNIVYSINGTSESLDVIYSSSDESIATVENGIITAIGIGKTKIKVEIKNYSDIYKEVEVEVYNDDSLIIDKIISWAKDLIGNEISMPVKFPNTHHEYGSEITWVSSDITKLSNNGIPYQQKYDTNVDLKVTVKYKSLIKSETFSVVITGYAPEEVASTFFKQFGSVITRDFLVKTTNSTYPDAKITWSSSNPDVFTNEGKYIQPFNDTTFKIFVTIVFENDGIIKQFSKDFVAKGVSIADKADTIKNWIINNQGIKDVIQEDIELPTKYEEYNASLTWSSNKPQVISSTGSIIAPGANTLVDLKCVVNIEAQTSSFILELEVVGKNYIDKWNAVDSLLDLIFLDEIKVQRYSVDGVGPSYITYNYGYLPFYFNEKSIILDGFLPVSNVNRPGRIKSQTRWITIHDTANNKAGADAEMHNDFIKNATNASWHYTVDDNKIYQHIPDEEVAWHAGTSEGNNYGIGIETCINIGVDYNTVMRKTAKLTAELLSEFDLTLTNVRQHFFFSGKDCPHVMRSSNRWNEFLDLVSIEYLAITQLQGVEFKWETLTPNYLDNNGKIYNYPGFETNISYKVTVTYNGVSKEYSHTSKLSSPTWI